MFQSFLKDNAVTVGMRKDALDIEKLEKEIRSPARYTPFLCNQEECWRRILWNVPGPIITENEEKEVGNDLVSAYAGTVVSIVVRSGVPTVAAGDTVEAGTVLVEGKVPIYNDDVNQQLRTGQSGGSPGYLRKASPDLLFQDYIKKEYTGREKTKLYFRFGEKQLKMPQDRPFLVYDFFSRRRPACRISSACAPLTFPVSSNIHSSIDSDCICHTISGKPVKPKTLGQKAYVDAIRNNMIVFWYSAPHPE